ncbi:mechanosensitive ion channel family protein, partial [bacterium]|nr:mechanosensitive ion channel family protein [bacterium]
MNLQLPEFGNKFGDAAMAALIFAALTFIVYWIARWMMKRLLKSFAVRTTTTLDDNLIKTSTRPLGKLILFVGLGYVVDSFAEFIPTAIDRHIDGIIYVIVVFFISVWLMKLVEAFWGWYAQTIASRTQSTADDEFIPLFVRISKIVIGVIAIIIILKHFNHDVQSLVVSLGVGSLAIALAAQETLSNMIAGFVIMTDRPFRIGDRLELSDGKVGDVYQVGLRSTKLMTFDNTLLIVPNSEIV